MLRRESNKDWMKGQIASSLPGRLRLRVDGLAFLFDARMDVAGALATIAGVRRVQVTPCTGSVFLSRYCAVRPLSIIAAPVSKSMASGSL